MSCCSTFERHHVGNTVMCVGWSWLILNLQAFACKFNRNLAGHGCRVARGFVSWLKGTGYESQCAYAAKSTCTPTYASTTCIWIQRMSLWIKVTAKLPISSCKWEFIILFVGEATFAGFALLRAYFLIDLWKLADVSQLSCGLCSGRPHTLGWSLESPPDRIAM